MKANTNYLPGSKTKQSLCLQPTQKSLWPSKVLQQVKQAKQKEPPKQIMLNTYIPFGVHKGKLINQLLANEQFINWFAATTRRPLSAEVINAIQTHKFLSA